MMSETYQKYEAWALIGRGIMWFLILVGIGSCSVMLYHDTDKPLIVIQQSSK